MLIPQPYLLFLGDAKNHLAIKTVRDIKVWKPEQCLGEHHLLGCKVSLGLEKMSIAKAKQLGAKTLVIGAVNSGGNLPKHWISSIIEAIKAGMNVANGLHHYLIDEPNLNLLAKIHNVSLIDIYNIQPKLSIGNGKPRQGNRILTVGTDCSVGKMYTSLALEISMRKMGIKTKFCATGQTGILIASEGIPINAVISDFISGAVEILTPSNSSNHWDIIEGQGSLFHPSYAGVSTGLIHGAQPDWLVMCHEMGRKHMRYLPHQPIVNLIDCVDANLQVAKLTSRNPRLAGFSINTSSYTQEEALAYCRQVSAEFGVPATDPMRFSIDSIIKVF
jgi:uncharacterized NAD-dependent epimerase/dehydratase family protein